MAADGPKPHDPRDAPHGGDLGTRTAWAVYGGLLLLGGLVLGRYFGHDGGSLWGYFSCDLYALLADGFRQGRLSLPLSADDVLILDATPWGNEMHLHNPPLPAVIYAALDAFTDLFAMRPFPKVALYMVAVALHLFALFRILGRLLARPLIAPLLLVLVYGASHPFLTFAAGEEIGASEVDNLFASTLMLVAAWQLLEARLRPWRHAPWILAALCLACVPLARQTYLAYALGLTAAAFFAGGGIGRPLGLAASVAFGLVMLLAYNFLRFGDVTNFGHDYCNSAMWEYAVFDFGLLPHDAVRYDHHLTEAIQGWFGLGPPIEHGATLFEPEDPVFLGVTINVFLVGILISAARWLRTPLRSALELALLGSAIVVLTFYVLIHQSSTVRYAMDIWPALYIAGVLGLVALAERAGSRVRPTVRDVSLIVIIGGQALYSWVWGPTAPTLSALITGEGRGVAAISDEPVDAAAISDPTRPRFCERLERRYRGRWSDHGRPPAVITCDQLSPTTCDRPVDCTWRRQAAPHLGRLGVYRTAADRCYALFFSGARFARTPGAECEALFTFADPSLDCADIEMRVDGYPSGRMERAADSSIGGTTCRGSIPSSERTSVWVYGQFVSDIKLVEERWPSEPRSPKPADLRHVTPHREWTRLAVRCVSGSL